MAEIPFIQNLANPTALAGLALIIPVILLYLLKPKPKHIMFPSTMFLLFVERHKRFSSFLQKFIRDPLLLFQIIIIAILVFTIASPFITSLDIVRGKESNVIVIDASASMQATDVSPDRFSKAIETAKNIISDMKSHDEASILLAENIPITVLNRGDRVEAMSLLGALEPSDTPSNVGEAILLAKDILLSSKAAGKIYVISDFSGHDGLEPILGGKIAAMSGIEVKYISVGGESDNSGIVSFNARRSVVDEDRMFATASVKNFGRSRQVTLNLYSQDEFIASNSKNIGSGGEEFFSFNPNITWAEQVIEARIDEEDYLTVDNTAYASVSGVKINKILLITGESDTDKYLRLMLQSLRNIDLKIVIPPEPIRDYSGFDMIILGNAEGDKILPGTFDDIKASVIKGADLIVVASDGLWSLTTDELWSIMPISIIKKDPIESEVIVLEEHDMLRDVVFDNVVATDYYDIDIHDNSSIEILGVRGDNPTTLFTYRRLGKGHIAFMGLNPDPLWSNLYYSSSFPIFWSQMIKFFVSDREKKSVLDYSSGAYMPLYDVMNVKTPKGDVIKTNNVFLDKVGLYELSNDVKSESITVSLLNPRESNISIGSIDEAIQTSDFNTRREKVEVKHEYYKILLVFMILILIFEMMMYRRRGLI